MPDDCEHHPTAHQHRRDQLDFAMTKLTVLILSATIALCLRNIIFLTDYFILHRPAERAGLPQLGASRNHD